jgi:hypothetical protein
MARYVVKVVCSRCGNEPFEYEVRALDPRVAAILAKEEADALCAVNGTHRVVGKPKEKEA